MNDDTKIEVDRKINKSKGFKAQEVIILVIITCLFSFFAGSAFSRMSRPDDSELGPISDELRSFIENYQFLLDNFYGELDEEELLREAFRALMELLDDPYSLYMDDGEHSSFNLHLEGSYRGLGISVFKTEEDGHIIVSAVFPGSPADELGIIVGDIIISINGIDSRTISTSDFSAMVLSGDKDDFVLVKRRGSVERTLTITRGSVVIPSVEYEMIESNGTKIGYISIMTFANNTYRQFSSALNNLESQNMDSLIIDVRNNTGGHLTVVSRIISLFVDSTHVAYQTQQNGVRTPIQSVGNRTRKYPIVFLTNRHSASGSEVLVMSLRDNLGARVIGEKTFGKGTVQELITLSNGDRLRVTTKRWLSPKGDWVNDTGGVIPDVEVTLNREFLANPTRTNDNQLQAAINDLRNTTR